MTKRKIVDCDKRVRPLTDEESCLVNGGYEAGSFSRQQEIDDLRTQLKELDEKMLEMDKIIKSQTEQIEHLLNEGLMQ